MNPDFTRVTKMLSIESVADILMQMMDGKFHTVNELAKIAMIKQNTASYHLSKMKDYGWLDIEKQSRHTYYRLSSNDIADLIEQLMTSSQLKQIKSSKEAKEQNRLFNARTCYDHLAGKFGVCLTDWLILKKYIENTQKNVTVTKKGEQFFSEVLNIDINTLKKKKRKFAIMCLDWSERRYHLAGSLGNAIFDYFKKNNFIVFSESSRAIELTKIGEKEIIEKWDAPDLIEMYENSIYR